jgi:carbon monoxide dehydrogenase subunit G
MEFQGERSYAALAEALYARLADAAFLVSCIPDATITGTPTPDAAQCTIRPSLSFVRGNLDVTIAIASRQPPTELKFTIASKGIGSSADVAAALTIEPHGDAASKIHWNAAVVKLGGLLKAVPQGLIRGAANKVIEDVWTSIDAKLNASPT